jgi:hypothetical protein
MRLSLLENIRYRTKWRSRLGYNKWVQDFREPKIMARVMKIFGKSLIRTESKINETITNMPPIGGTIMRFQRYNK